MICKWEKNITLKREGLLFHWMNSFFQILKLCNEEFGFEVPSHQLKDINSVKDIVKYYCSMRAPSTKTFESIDLDKLPPNLQIGGKVPRKQT